MKRGVLSAVLAAALMLALLAPAVASAQENDRYTVYGKQLRQTFGASLGHHTVRDPNSFGVRLGHNRAINSRSFGVRIGQYHVLPTDTFGSRLANPTRNPNVIPKRLGNVDPSVVAF